MAKLALLSLVFVLLFYVSLSVQDPSSFMLNVTTPIPFITNHPKSSATKRIKLGVVSLGGIFGNDTHVGTLAAAEYFNHNNTILPDIAIDLYISPPATDTENLFATLYQIQELGIHGIVGAQTSQQARIVQSVAKLYKIPQMAPSCLSYILSDKGEYPYFSRMTPNDIAQISGILHLFTDNGWKKALIIYSQNEEIVVQATGLGISTLAFPISAVASNSDYITLAQRVSTAVSAQGYRIVIFYTDSPTIYVAQALVGGSVDYIRLPENDHFNKTWLQGAFGFGAGLPSGPEYDSAVAYWNTITHYVDLPFLISGFYAWDTVYAYVHAFKSLLDSGIAFELIEREVLQQQMVSQQFLGTTGRVVIDENGDRAGFYEVYNWYGPNTDRKVKRVATLNILDNTFDRHDSYTFFDGTNTPPRDSPFSCAACNHGKCVENVGCECDKGWKGSTCDVKDTNGTEHLIKWLIPVIVAMLLAFVGVYFWYHKKRRALVKNVSDRQRSQIARTDLQLTDRIGRGASGEVCKGVLRGTDVAVKRIIASHVSKSIIEEFELEVAIMCGLRHPNIILFMGSCYDPTGGEMLLVMELMSRGSLNDVLNNNKIPLAHDMLLHIATQAAQGMNFLHQSTPPIIHHDLKSHNILLDDKWNARISDFGITRFKESNKAKENKSLGTIYWSAPELLAGEHITEKIDCYAFGIVLWEIFHRLTPYAGRDPMSVAIDVIRKNLRPTIAHSISPEIRELITACWAQNPNDRPDFQEIMTTLRGLTAHYPVQSYDTSAAVRVDAPSGMVYLLSTDIIGAYALWDAEPKAMEAAVKLHIQLLRTNMDNYRGYEVSYIEHSFTIAFGTVEDVSNFCIASQLSLLNASWPAEILNQPAGEAVYNNGLMWKGLRVKMAVVSGVPNCAIDPSTGRMLYFGPVADKSIKLLAIPHDTVVFSDVVASEFGKKAMKLIQSATVRKIGDTPGSARGKTENIHQLVIDSLAGRNSLDKGETSSGAILPHMVVAVHDYDDETQGNAIPLTPKMSDNKVTKPVDWIAKDSDITNRVPIGKGSIGDYFRASWKGKEVALKVLVNQKLKEDDMLRLIADSSIMRKMNHPNVLPFFSICVEPNQYEARGNLKAILADTSVQLSFPNKVKLMLDLARGMAYIASHPEPSMRMHDNLKSNNVLLSKEWDIKIADYGHSNIRELARTLTSVGNIAWTAPEILNGDPATVKIAQYSFGIICWETYTRQVPYLNEHAIKVVSKILNGYRPTIPTDCPPAFSSLIQKCLANNPDERPEWEEVIQILITIQ